MTDNPHPAQAAMDALLEIDQAVDPPRRRPIPPLELARGTYHTRDGTEAYLWELWKDPQTEETLWRGTVKGGGFTCWTLDGIECGGSKGYPAWDLVERIRG